MFGVRSKLAPLALFAFLALAAAGCGVTSQKRVMNCHDARVGETRRGAVEAAFGAPALKLYVERDGRQIVEEGWLSRGASMTFDVASGYLIAKECAGQ